MLFNSPEFLLFFSLVTIAYFLIPQKFRWALLLVSSCIFYMWFIPIYILVLALTIIIDYSAGILIENSNEKRKKNWLIISVLSTCLVLFVFKYVNFFNSNFEAISKLLGLNYPIGVLNIILPIGLSFHTFQSLSYVIEVYRGNQKAEKHFGIYALYVMFYPQLVAGPIERPQNLLHQFKEEHYFEYGRVTDGLKLMAWGMLKKVVIADRLAIAVNHVYNSPANYSGLSLIVATIFFSFQIYCDFSGYSDIAIGASQVMGFKLMNNFNRPYFSKSISEFWKRWHISLSSWFRDYLYISMGGNRVSKSRWYFNLFITFVISGMWHGASWTYIIWGALNGLYLLFAIWTKGVRIKVIELLGMQKFPGIIKFIRVFITFLLVSFAWIFFRARNLSDARYIVTHLFTNPGNFVSPEYLLAAVKDTGLKATEFLIAVSSIILLIVVQLVQRNYKVRKVLSEQPLSFRWSLYYAIILIILVFGIYGKHDFIYFQF